MCMSAYVSLLHVLTHLLLALLVALSWLLLHPPAISLTLFIPCTFFLKFLPPLLSPLPPIPTVKYTLPLPSLTPPTVLPHLALR